MASKMARFFQQLAVDAEFQRRFQAGGDSRDVLLQQEGFTATERAMICAEDSNALHRQMMADLGDDQVQWNNNNTNQNISKFKRPDTCAQ
jgi:hypothetical protein